MRIPSLALAVALVVFGGGEAPVVSAGQGPAGGSRLTIPYLANATKPTDLDFAAAQCDLAANGDQMTCRFRQVFLTATSVDPTSCAITTNGYELKFRREAGTRWVSRTAPSGACGVVETTILDDEGGTRWTMTTRLTATLRTDSAECRTAAQEPEVYDWRNVKRTLPCTSIQPGAIER